MPCCGADVNEDEVGDALHEAFAQRIVRRDDVYVASKLWNTFHRPERVRPAIEASLKRLRMKELDLFLVHWPVAFVYRSEDDHLPKDASGQYLIDRGVTLEQTWAAMEVRSCRVRAMSTDVCVRAFARPAHRSWCVPA